MTPIRIAYVNLFVNDLERAVAFYETKLGLARKFVDADHGYASFDAGAIGLGLAVAGPEQRELVGRHTGIGLAVGDLVKTHERLAALGVSFPTAPERQPWGGFMAMLADPDGNLLYLDEVAAAHGG
jgi:predicted enzyme related to lactoylglutathione lyase